MSTGNLGSPAIWIWSAGDGASNFLIETRPTTTRVKLGSGSVESGVAAAAVVGAFAPKIIVLTRVGRLSTFLFNDSNLGRGEGIPGFVGHVDSIAEL